MSKFNPMSPANLPQPEPVPEEMEISVRQLWDAAVGKVFKLVSKDYGTRNVTYTQVKGVRDAKPAGSGAFEIEVLCVEVMARTLSSKRTQSNICKEGVLREEANTDLIPESFGVECPLAEFERITNAILAYTNSYLDWVMQPDPEQQTDIPAAIDFPHLMLTDMEASLVRNSPFLSKNTYFITGNSIVAAQVSIQQELQRAQRGILLTDAVDANYVARKNEAIASLQAKLKDAAQEMETGRILASVEKQQRENELVERRRPGFASLQLDSLTLALLGKPSTTTVRWANANPSEDGVVFCLGGHCAPLDFVRWAHISGRALTEDALVKLKLQDFFKGWKQAYTGPNAEGYYPMLKPATN